MEDLDAPIFSSISSSMASSSVWNRLQTRRLIARKASRNHICIHVNEKLEKAEKKRKELHLCKQTEARKKYTHARQIAQEQTNKQNSMCASLATHMSVRQSKAQEKRGHLLGLRVAQWKITKHRLNHVLDYQQQHVLRAETKETMLYQQLCSAEARRDQQMQQRVMKAWTHSRMVDARKKRGQAKKTIRRELNAVIKSKKWRDQMRANRNALQTILNTWEKVSKEPIETCIGEMQSKTLRESATQWMKLMPKNKDLPKQSRKYATARVLLIAGMLTTHPDEVMEEYHHGSGQLHCKRLFYAAQNIIREFKCLNEKLNMNMATSEAGKSIEISNYNAEKNMLSRIKGIYVFYIESFGLWKSIDEDKMAEEMFETYVQMYRTNAHTISSYKEANSNDGIHEIIAGTNGQLEELKVAITKVVGKRKAEERICQIQKEIDDQMKQKEQREKTKVLPLQLSTQEKETCREAVDEEKSTKEESTIQSLSRLPMDKTLLNNEQIVHEMIFDTSNSIDQSAKVSQTTASPFNLDVENRIDDRKNKAFWDTFRSNLLSQDETASHMLANQFRDLRDKFCNLLPDKNSSKQHIRAALSEDQIRDSCVYPFSVLLLSNMCLYLLEQLKHNEAPERVHKTNEMINHVKSVWNSKEVILADRLNILVDFFIFMQSKLKLLSMDMMNAHLRLLAPYVQQHGVEYEKEKVQEKLLKGTLETTKTEEWMQMEISEFYCGLEASHQQAFRQRMASEKQRFLRHCLMQLIKNYAGKETMPWPETYAMDTHRITAYRNSIDAIVVKATLIATLQQQLSSVERVRLREETIERLYQQLDQLLESSETRGSDLSMHLVHQVEGEIEGDNTPGTLSITRRQQLCEALKESIKAGHLVFDLFQSRCMDYLTQTLALNEERKTMMVYPPMPASLSSFLNALQDIAKNIVRLYRHNRLVYANIYNDLIDKSLDIVQND